MKRKNIKQRKNHAHRHDHHCRPLDRAMSMVLSLL